MKAEQHATNMNPWPRRPWMAIGLVLAASFAVRIAAWSYWHTGAIESEGAEYARIAQNLRSGVGFVGLVTPGPQLNFNPLFSFLIAAASFLTHNDFELAGRLIALIMGSLLPLPVLGIGSRLFNRRVGFIAATMILLHPLLIHLSFTVFSEGPYATLLLTAIYLVVRALQQSSIKPWFLVGAVFGLAWLVRAEASAAFAAAILFAVLATPGEWSARCKRALAAVAVFMAVVSPQLAFIYRSTGKVRLEAKSTIFFYTGLRILAAERNPGIDYISPGGHYEVPSPDPDVKSGMPWAHKWAFYGIDSHLYGMGFPLRQHTEIIRTTQVKLKDVAILLAKGVRLNAPALFERLSADWFGGPLLPALALLGVLRRPLRRPRASGRFFVMVVSLAPVLATFTALWNEQRYYFVFIPLLAIWAANGLFEITLWTRASLRTAGSKILKHPVLSDCVIPGLIGLILVGIPILGLPHIGVFAESAPDTSVDKELGQWIGRKQDHSVRIMDLQIPRAFHAGARFSYFPYCSSEQALQYLDAAQIDYVVLQRGAKFTRYYDTWLTQGIPDSRAERLDLSSISNAEKYFVVFRWHRASPVESLPAASQFPFSSHAAPRS